MTARPFKARRLDRSYGACAYCLKITAELHTCLSCSNKVCRKDYFWCGEKCGYGLCRQCQDSAPEFAVQHLPGKWLCQECIASEECQSKCGACNEKVVEWDVYFCETCGVRLCSVCQGPAEENSGRFKGRRSCSWCLHARLWNANRSAPSRPSQSSAAATSTE